MDKSRDEWKSTERGQPFFYSLDRAWMNNGPACTLFTNIYIYTPTPFVLRNFPSNDSYLYRIKYYRDLYYQTHLQLPIKQIKKSINQKYTLKNFKVYSKNF